MIRKFWRLRLQELHPLEWESLCDGCAKCCYVGTALGVRQGGAPCNLLDLETNCCTDYANRLTRRVHCNPVTLATIPKLGLPSTCAYRRRYNSEPLEGWQVAKARSNFLKKLEAARNEQIRETPRKKA